ncbi:MAG: NADPH:quinone oxidoreductase family protein [Actinobacteria bacterium]|nr:NADPH:quinone oxidoreductase family protein [Actinomycetota bacterium]
MRALICDDYAGIDALRVGDLPEPTQGPGQVLVEVASVAVNYADTLMVSGRYQTRPETPFAPGYELSGAVLAGADGLEPGDRVCGFTWHGGMAERAAVPVTQTALLHDRIDFDTGAVLPSTYGTSYHALVDRAGLQAGETLLVLGAAGGVGLAAVQIGKTLGATVLAAVSTDEKQRLVESSGADHVIRYDRVGLRDGIAEATNDAGVDVVFDPVGGDMTESALRSTRWNGRLLVIGFASGPIPAIPLNLPLLKGTSIVGVFWGRFTSEEPERARVNLDHILELTEKGTLRPTISGRYGLDEGAKALRLVADRRSLGRVVINP